MAGADHVGMRKLIGGMLAALMIVVLTPVAAHATALEIREERTTDFDTYQGKWITVPCPPGKAVIGAGARTEGANGRVVLTGIVPDSSLATVTAYARALDGFDSPWALTVVAICGYRAEHGVVRVAGDNVGEFASASCGEGKVLYSTGYWINEALQGQYVDAVIPTVDQSGLVVHAEGGSSPLDLRAYGICGYNNDPIGRRSNVVPLNPAVTAGTAPPVHVGDPPTLSSMVLGAGVRASVDGLFIDGIGPSECICTGTSHARMARLNPVLPMRGLLRTATDDEGGEMTVYSLSIGSWY